MVVADKKQSLTITGTGDVLEPNDGVIGDLRFRALLPNLGEAQLPSLAFALQQLAQEGRMHLRLQGL